MIDVVARKLMKSFRVLVEILLPHEKPMRSQKFQLFLGQLDSGSVHYLFNSKVSLQKLIGCEQFWHQKFVENSTL